MKLRFRIAAFLLPPVYRLWTSTLRCEEIGREKLEAIAAAGNVFVLGAWHGEIFGLLHARRNMKMVGVVSKSKDGDFGARVLGKLGFKLARGSSSRGGAEALRTAVKAMRQGYSLCITMDGPRGPRHRIKDGVFYTASLGNACLVPARVMYTRGKHLKSWDRFFLPLPFSRVRIIYDEPYPITAATLDAEALAAERKRMQDKMEALNRYAFEGYPPS